MRKKPPIASKSWKRGVPCLTAQKTAGYCSEIYMEVTVLGLLKDGDRVVGCVAYEREHGRFRIFKTKALILATGGVGRAYKVTSNSWEGTGDGHTLAYDAGA